MKIKIKRIVFFTCVLFCMTAIFIFSSQNADTSGNLSGGITRKIAEILVRGFREMEPAKQTEIIDTMHFYIRKSAHFGIYAFLGFFMFAAINTYKIKLPKKFIITVLFCVLYASSDEIHQLFSSGRSCSPRDVIIDSFGSMTGCIFSWGISFLKNFFRKSIDK